MHDKGTVRRPLAAEVVAGVSLEQALDDARHADERLAQLLERNARLEDDVLQLRAEVGNLQLLLAQERQEVSALRRSRSRGAVQRLSRALAAARR